MSDLLSRRYLSNPEGLTVRQLKAHIADWPDETPDGVPTRALMVLVDQSDAGEYLYVPVGEATEVHVNGETDHLILMPQKLVGKLLHGTHNPNGGSA